MKLLLICLSIYDFRENIQAVNMDQPGLKYLVITRHPKF